MKKNEKNFGMLGFLFLAVFALWTWLIQAVDVQPVGPGGTQVGFAVVNRWFHEVTGVHMKLYTVTDWLGLIPVFACLGFAVLGMYQSIRRRSLWKVDADLVCLGVYYLIVILAYLAFEMVPVNYRPIRIEGRLEASYPSSTTLLVLCVMPTCVEQLKRRWKHAAGKKTTEILAVGFSLFMVIGRLVSGVHWLTDILGAIWLSTGLFCVYKALILASCRRKKKEGDLYGIS